MSSLNGKLGDIIRDANGGRVGGRDSQMFTEKHSLFSKVTMKALREQWKAAGRGNAQVYLKLTEANGSNPHFVTGYDGKGTFVCFTEQGLQHVSLGRLQKLTLDENWNPKTLLVHVRQPYHQENVTRDGVDAMLQAARQPITEGEKGGSVDTPYKKTPTGPQKAPKHTTGAPPAAPGGPPSAGKAPAANAKPDKSSNYSWDCCEERRGIKHPMMKGKDEPTAKDSNGETRQNVTTRNECFSYICAMCGKDRSSIAQTEDVSKDVSACGECGATQVVEIRREDMDASQDKDEHGEKRNGITTRSEGGKQKGVSGGQGNKSDPQLDKRQQVDLRAESAESKDAKHKDPQKPANKTYWQDAVKDPEKKQRTEVPIRKEDKDGTAYEHPLAQCESFHPGKSHEQWLHTRWMLNNRGSKAEGPIQAKPQHEAAFGHPLSDCKTYHPGKSHDEWYKSMDQLNNRGGKAETPLMLFPGQKKDAHCEADEGGSLFAGTKKPKLLLILMAKKKHAMAEGKEKEPKNPMPYKAIKRPNEETARQDVDSRRTEDLTPSSLKLVGEDEGGHDDWHSKHGHKFARNAQMMKNRQGPFARRKNKESQTHALVMHEKPAHATPPGHQSQPHKPTTFQPKPQHQASTAPSPVKGNYPHMR